jgi:short-subunit dehydrogenase
MTAALITGASAGLGRGYALALAEQGHDVVLVARRADRLEALADQVRDEHRVRCEVLPADLADADGRARVADRLRDSDPQRAVEVLVNNAGLSTNQRFVGGDWDAERAALDVMVTAPMLLCHAALPGMVERGSGTVLNISSIASWATEGTYSAAKAWLRTFTEGLAAELGGTGVSVTAVCPGGIRTEFFEQSGLDLRLPGFLWMDVDSVVQASLADARRGHLISVPGVQYQAMSTAAQYLPRPLVRFMTKHREDLLR